MSLEQELRSLPQFEGGLVRLSDVLKLTQDAWLVKPSPEIHNGSPESEIIGEVWAVLDTVYDILRRYSPLVLLGAIRCDLPDGYDFPDNATLEAEIAAHGGPASLAEVVKPNRDMAAMMLAQVFSLLQGQAANIMTEFSPSLQAAEPVCNEKYEREDAEQESIEDLLSGIHGLLGGEEGTG